MKRYILFLITFMAFGPLLAQTANIIQPEPINLPVHKANIGKVVFLADTISLNQLRETDFLNKFEAKPSNNLYIKLLMGNSLTNY